MREIRVFTDQPLAPGMNVTLEDSVARHLGAVLRLQPGDPVTLFNGTGGEYPATLSRCSGKRVSATIVEFIDADRESPLQIHLGIGLSRGDRMDWAIQKATEAGVSEITPLLTERTEVKLKGDRADKKQRHWQQICASACEQCYRNRLPRLNEPATLSHWLSQAEAEKRFVLHHRGNQSLSHLRSQHISSVALLIGPEGGLSTAEIEAAIHSGFEPLTLGPRVFRTETAPVVAISVLQSLWGDFL
ncbi:MAG: 16S rRNA (uracil(1498)-N(3))-methyltransferase [Gammaproteobacteria bacterium]|nr:MAG: 16S rRNA (uracil(1498)-N(3))-methyltransferase [Gammaproteobacteria bacterium]